MVLMGHRPPPLGTRRYAGVPRKQVGRLLASHPHDYGLWKSVVPVQLPRPRRMRDRGTLALQLELEAGCQGDRGDGESGGGGDIDVDGDGPSEGRQPPHGDDAGSAQ